jgi:hypothetical protein
VFARALAAESAFCFVPHDERAAARIVCTQAGRSCSSVTESPPPTRTRDGLLEESQSPAGRSADRIDHPRVPALPGKRTLRPVSPAAPELQRFDLNVRSSARNASRPSVCDATVAGSILVALRFAARSTPRLGRDHNRRVAFIATACTRPGIPAVTPGASLASERSVGAPVATRGSIDHGDRTVSQRSPQRLALGISTVAGLTPERACVSTWSTLRTTWFKERKIDTCEGQIVAVADGPSKHSCDGVPTVPPISAAASLAAHSTNFDHEVSCVVRRAGESSRVSSSRACSGLTQ